jgi:hypothetical protein
VYLENSFLRDLHVTRLLVVGDDPGGAAAVLGNSHADFGGVLPDTLGVMAKAHVVGARDGLTIVLAALGEEGLDGSRVRTISSAHIEVLTVVTLRMLEQAYRSEIVGPLLGTRGKRVIPRQRIVANGLTGLVVEVNGLLLIGGEIVAGTKVGTRTMAGGLFGRLDELDGGRLGVDGRGSVLLWNVRLLLKVGLLRLRNAGGLGRTTSTDNVVSDVLEVCNDLIMLVAVLPIVVVGSGYGAGGHQGNDGA